MGHLCPCGVVGTQGAHVLLLPNFDSVLRIIYFCYFQVLHVIFVSTLEQDWGQG